VPIPDGGALRVNNPALGLQRIEMRKRTLPNLVSLGIMAKTLLNFYPQWAKRKKEPGGSGGISQPGSSAGQKRLPASIWALNLLKKFDYEWAIEGRRRNFCWWLENAPRLGLKVLFDKLPEGVCPFGFPALLEEGRDEFIQELKKKKGVMLRLEWPGCSLVEGEHPNFEYLKRREVTLPVYPEFNERKLAFIADKIKEVMG